MQTQHLDITTPDGNCDAYAVWPSNNGTYPAVLLLMDAFGLRSYLFEMAGRLAELGYYVLVPNLFYRLKRSPVVEAEYPLTKDRMPAAHEQLMALFKNHDPEASLRDVGAFLDFLAQQKAVRPGPVGVTGYCMGGSLAVRAAAEYPDRIASAASFHGGRLATDAPNSPHRFAKSIKAKLYIAHADQDQSMPADQIELLKKALEEAHVKFEAELYSGAPHGFTMADLPAYNEPALKRHWNKLSALFAETLK